MSHNDFSVHQRAGKVLRLTVRDPGTREIVDPTSLGIVFVIKEKLTDLDADAIVVKRSVSTGGTVGEVEVVDTTTVKGPKKVLQINILSSDLPVTVAPGEYEFQIDLVPADPEQRQPAIIAGTVLILPTGIQGL